MKYSIKVNEVRAKEGSNIKGFATVVFGDSFKITNIAILENKDKGELFVSMPRYRSNERDESNGVIYKDVCNPITAEFREELYTNILDAYARIREPEKEETQKRDRTQGTKGSFEMPEFSVTVTPYEREGSNIKGLARIYFENSFIVNNINIVQGKEKIFVSMPRYRSNERDESNGVIYKDVCNPITAEFRDELYTNILDAYARIKEPEKDETQKQEHTKEMPEFSVTVTPYEREGSNIKGLARIYFENSFIVNNVNILQGKEKIFVSMPSYKTKQVDEQGKAIYQDVCYPVTKEFREKLYDEIISEYEKAKDKSNEKARESAEKHHGNPDKEKDKEATPFR